MQMTAVFAAVREQTRVAKHWGTSNSEKAAILWRSPELRAGTVEEGQWELWLWGRARGREVPSLLPRPLASDFHWQNPAGEPRDSLQADPPHSGKPLYSCGRADGEELGD